jgi:hypothetical protein
MTTLPNRIFFTGVPGSRWSGIAQILEQLPGFNTTDRTPDRTYDHHTFTGHLGAYFGKGMEFHPILSAEYIDQAHGNTKGTRLIKSHDWAYQLDDIKQEFPDDWTMLVYRPDMTSFAWWHEAGGFKIKYPCYNAYVDSINMMAEIASQNKAILDYACKKNAKWEYFTEEWMQQTFGHSIVLDKVWSDILVTMIK